MEVALISAFVAALVSIVGAIVQFLIARKARVSAEEAPRRQMLTDEKLLQLSVIRQTQEQLETMRMHIWELLGHLHFVIREFNVPSGILTNIDALQSSARGFAGLWAQTKFDIPDGAQTRLRGLWHEARPRISEAQTLAELLTKLQASNDAGATRRDTLRGVLEHVPGTVVSLEHTLDLLREFAEVLAAAKSMLLHARDDA